MTRLKPSSLTALAFFWYLNTYIFSIDCLLYFFLTFCYLNQTEHCRNKLSNTLPLNFFFFKYILWRTTVTFIPATALKIEFMGKWPFMNTLKLISELWLTSPEVPCPKNIVYVLCTKNVIILRFFYQNMLGSAVVIYWNSLDQSIKFITVFYLLAYKCVSHENFIAEAFYKLGSSGSIGKDKRAVLLPTTAFGDLSARLFLI